MFEMKIKEKNETRNLHVKEILFFVFKSFDGLSIGWTKTTKKPIR